MTVVNEKDVVAGLGKGLRVIEAFDDDHPRLTASQAAQRADMTRTAARRHLLSLVHFGYAETDGKQYWLTARVLRLGQSYLGSARLPRLVQPFIQRISQQLGETVNVAVLDGHEVVYVARSNPPRWMSIGYAVGVRVPAHVVTAGLAILGTWPETAVQQWVSEHSFTGFTAQTITSPERFLAEVRRSREQSYWASDGQLDPSFGGLSVPLMDRKGHCVASIGMIVVSASYPIARIEAELLPVLRETARLLRPIL